MTVRVLLVAFLVLVTVSAAVGASWVRHARAFVRLALSAVFVAAVVRMGLGLAIIAFGLTPASALLPLALGVLAWRLSPWREQAA